MCSNGERLLLGQLSHRAQILLATTVILPVLGQECRLRQGAHQLTEIYHFANILYYIVLQCIPKSHNCYQTPGLVRNNSLPAQVILCRPRFSPQGIDMRNRRRTLG